MSSTMLSPVEVRAVVMQDVKTSNFEVLGVQEVALGNQEGGFMSDYWRIKIHVRLDGLAEQTHQYFVKTVPKAKTVHREFVLEVQSYMKEMVFYEDILPLLQKYASGKKDTRENDVRGRWAPHCYLARDDIILMEDLSIVGFKVFSNRELMDWNHCAIVLKKIASLHAASITLEKKGNEISRRAYHIGDLFPEVFKIVIGKRMDNDPNKGWFVAGIRAFAALVPHLPKYNNNVELQRSIKENIPSVCQTNINLMGRSNQYRNVVCHGDVWSNNIMFRYQEDGIPNAVRLVDFQLLRYAPPASDITVFMYTNFNRDFRDQHKDNILNVYFKELAEELERNGVTVGEVLSFEELKSSYEYMSAGGRVVAVMYLQITTITKEERNSISSSPENFSRFFLTDRESEVCNWFATDEYYRSLMEEAAYELVENDILKK